LNQNSIYRKRVDNKINTAQDINLYHEDIKGHINMGFEVSINKNIRKRRDIGNNRSKPWY